MYRFTDNRLLVDKHILITIDESNSDDELKYVKEHFCGLTFDDINKLNEFLTNNTTTMGDVFIYLCGNIEKILEVIKTM